MVKRLDTQADSSVKSCVDANQNDPGVTKDTDEAKPQIIDTEDNPIAGFLYGGPIGYTVNFTLLITITVSLGISLRNMFNDEESFRTIIEPLWLPSVTQFLFVVIPLDIVLCVLIVLLVYPLSRLSRSTVYYWFLGLTFSGIIFASIWLVREHANIGSRILLIVEWGRLSSKIAAFLIECSWSDQVYKKSSMKSLSYFLGIPTLVYKPEYPVARRIRWVKVLCHIWWILGPGSAYLLFLYRFILPFVRIDLLRIEFNALVLFIFAGVIVWLLSYAFLAFLIIENFCGLHGELLRYPYLKLFGNPFQVRSAQDFLENYNILVGNWIIRYIYKPVVNGGGTHRRAMYFTISIIVAIHDLGFFYIGNLIILYSLVLGLGIAPGVLSLRPKRILHQVLMLVLMMPVLSFWIGSYFFEFIAWNYSSMPDVDQLSRIRIVPLFMIQLYQNFFASWI